MPMHIAIIEEFDQFFSTSFSHAQQQWQQRLTRLLADGKLTLQRSYPHPLTSPDGAPLGTELAWFGPADAAKVLVLIAGTHGIEGFAGSAIELMTLSLLDRQLLALPDNTALCIIHALTPWGFAWYRRCDERGIDLNRNFVDFGQPLPENPDFTRLQSALAATDVKQRETLLAMRMQQMGQRSFEMALSGGQYSDPAAPFFGGQQASHGRHVIESLIDEFDLARRQLIVIDLHTGLGPWGYGELICDHPADSPGTGFAQQLFGEAITLPSLGTSSSVPKKGLLDYAWHAIMGSNSCFLTLEFGTYSKDQLFNVLLDDHRFWSLQRPDQQTYPGWPAVRQQMLEHFCPADSWWRQSVLFKALQVIDQSLTGFSHGAQ